MDALTTIRTRNAVTPQSEQADPAQVPNNAGGYTFQVGDRQRALRFLILGAEGGTFYVSEKDLTKDNATVILRMAETDGVELVKLILDVSQAGRAPKQNPTLFALAVCAASSDNLTRQAAFKAIPFVCRTGTMLFIFARYVEQFRGWGRGLRKAIGDWYLTPDVDRVAYQAVKYRQREGWSHRDLLRLAHPATLDADRKALFEWICRGEMADVPIVAGYIEAQAATTAAAWAHLIEQYRLSWEMLPDAALKEPTVWEALLPHMGLTALVRNLGRLTSLGVIKALTDVSPIVGRLTDEAEVKKARLHPLKVLDALKTYSNGAGFRGGLTWTPVPQVIDALDRCFYLSFGAVAPANKRTMIALDVSGSMAGGAIANSLMTPREVSAAMAMVTARTEPQYLVTAFSHQMVPIVITAAQSVNDAIRTVSDLPFDRTDCAQPMLFAAANGLPVDTFQILTDNETWYGSIHPHQALRDYRQKSGIDARLAVVGMTATDFTIVDPSDPGQLDVVGFDTATPDLISGFSRGDF